MNTDSLQQQVTALLQSGHALTVRWDCGGDENFVYTDLDGVEQPFDFTDGANNLAVSLGDYLTELLELPSVGEFSLSGQGRIFLEGPAIVLEYNSEYLDYDDGDWQADFTDEQLAEMGVTRRVASAESDASTAPDEPAGTLDAELSEEYSGRQVLFEAI